MLKCSSAWIAGSSPTMPNTKSFSRAPASELCSPPPIKRFAIPRKSRGRRSAERRIRPMSRRAIRCCHLKALRARCPHPTLPRTRERAGRGLAFRRSTAALAKATERFGSAQAALRAKERAPALPAPSIALKRSTPRPGRSAGGDDARAARDRHYCLVRIINAIYQCITDVVRSCPVARKYIGSAPTMLFLKASAFLRI